MERYERQLILSGFGQKGQKALEQSRVLVIGAGGLGSPVLLYLAASGVGNITLVEEDTVSTTNLNRQILYHTADVGQAKASVATKVLSSLNPAVRVTPIYRRLTEENGEAFFAGHHLVVDCVDNDATRYLVNQLCMTLRIPLVEAGINGFDGYVLPILPHESACFACVYPKKENVVSGVGKPIPSMGAAMGAVGAMQVAVAIRMLAGMPVPVGTLSLFSLGSLTGTQIVMKRRSDCPVCGTGV